MNDALRPIVLIAAVGRNGAIGLRNGLPWRLPGDLKYFKAQTMGKPVIMGRKTFESLGRPLPGRFLVVASRDHGLVLPDGVERAASIGEALWRGQVLAAEHGAGEVMVAGGAEVYRAVMGRADVLRLTEVDLAPEADSVFPTIDPVVWREASRMPGERGAEDEAAFAHVAHCRR